MSLDARQVDRLERYLDGLLAGEELAAFERELASSRELQLEVDLQRQIDAGLRRLFEMRQAPEGVVARTWWRFGPWAAAAAIALIAAGAWWWMLRPPSGPDPLEAEYVAVVAAGFTPQVVCTDDATFSKWVSDKFGQELRPKADRAGVEYVGWNVSRAMSSYSGLLLARVEGREVVVLIDRRAYEDERLPQPADESLNQYRRVFGELVLYEITPLDRPAVLDSLKKP